MGRHLVEPDRLDGPDRAVEVRGLTVRRGRSDVLHDLDLDIPRGSITGLLGPSGCGKTTLMRCVVGVQKVRAGTVTVLGGPAGTPALRRRVAYATQAASVYPDLTVEQNLHYFSRLVSAPRDDVERAITHVSLGEQRRQRVESLSGGQRGRVSLGIAMLGSPQLMVLDEPTVGLDPVLRAELWAVFRELTQTGSTILLSSHVMDEALRCDRLLLMRDGRLLANTTPNGLLNQTGETDPDEAFLRLIERSAA